MQQKSTKPKIEKENINAILKKPMETLVTAVKEAKTSLTEDAEKEILELQKQLLNAKRDLSEMEKSFLRKVGRYQAKAKLGKATAEIFEIYSKKKVNQKQN